MVVSMLCQYADYIALLTDANVNNMLFVETLKLWCGTSWWSGTVVERRSLTGELSL